MEARVWVRVRVRVRVSAQQIVVARVDDDPEELDAIRVVELRPQPDLVLQQRQVLRPEPCLRDLLSHRLLPIQLALEDSAEAARTEPGKERKVGAQYAAAAVGCLELVPKSGRHSLCA